MRLPFLVSAVLLTGTVLAPVADAAGPGADRPAEPRAELSPAEGPIVQMFGWPWDSVAKECKNALGPSGYTAIQVSEPTEHVQLKEKNYPWYEDYQPASYKLDSRRGNGQQFQKMVSACNDAGVKVYADVVLNHMSGTESVGSGPGSGGSEFEKYNYPGLYNDGDFHGCRRDIEDYSNLEEVRHCELVGLSDLKTESENVRKAEIAYLNKLVDMGVSGFRVDGAKHMAPEDIKAIVDGLHNVNGGKPHIYQEVIADEATQPSMYAGNGDVTEFSYMDKVANAFNDGNIAQLKTLPDEMQVKSENANVFVANHDTERSNPTLTYKDGKAYDLAAAFSMAYPFGTPRFVSGFDFGENVDAGPPSDDQGMTQPASCGDNSQWTCVHRHPAVAGMAGFARAVQGKNELTNWWDNGQGMVAFGRGNAGFVVLNVGGGEQDADRGSVTQEFTSSLPAGTYCNVLTGNFHDGQCDGETVDVGEGGGFTAEVGANSGVALHTKAKVS